MNYELKENIARIGMDDGKANAIGHTMMEFIESSLDRALEDGAQAVILRGREGLFSGGFDIGEFHRKTCNKVITG